MKCLYWNIRGMGNIETQVHLFHMIKKHKPDLLFLAEPLVSFTAIPFWYWHKLNLHHSVVNNNNNTPTIWCLWNNKYKLNILMNNDQCITFTCIDEGKIIHIAAIYAATLYTTRRDLWLNLSNLLNNNEGPWMFIGDFNSILDTHEKKGGKLPLQIACSEFLSWSNVNSLIHLDTNGAQFTWTNKREGGAFIAQRLDRAICNESWLDHWNII